MEISKENPGPRIIQIIPATGVKVIYRDGKGYPVVCWALVELWRDWQMHEDGEIGFVNRQVQGMIIIDGLLELELVGDGSVEATKKYISSYVYAEGDS